MADYIPTTPRSIPEVRAELDKVAASIRTLLHRDGTAPNQMEADFDMNDYDLLNARVAGVSLDDLINDLDQVIVDIARDYTPTRTDFSATGGQTVFPIGTESLLNVQFFIGGKLANEDDYVVNSPVQGQVEWVGYTITAGVDVVIYSNTLSNVVGETTSGVFYKTVEDMKNNVKTGAAIDLAGMANNGDVVQTMGYHEVGRGNAKYYVTTQTAYRALIGDPTWTPDGYRDHYLLGGTAYVAVLLPEQEGVIIAAQYGVQYNLNTAATENTARLNAAIEYLSPFPWEGTSDATYFQKAISGGVVKLDKGFVSVDGTILLNPRVMIEGVTPVDRIFGKINVSAGEQITIINYVGAEASICVVDTANYKDAFPSLRTTDSTQSFFNSSLDARETTWSEGSFLKNLAIVNNGTGRGAAVGFRMAAAMKGGYDGVAVSGFDVGCILSNVFNWTLGSLWIEECYFDMLFFEGTNIRAKGQHTLVGNSLTKAVAPDEVFNRIPQYFGTNFQSDDDQTIPLVHARQSKGIYCSFCTEPVFDNLAIEFKANPICVYGNAGSTFFTVRDFSEEGNAFTMDIGASLGVSSVITTGFNCQFRFEEMSSLSDAPFQACGINSSFFITAAKAWVGDSFYPDYMDNIVRGNPFVLEEIRTITPKLRRDHNVSIRGLKRDLTLWCDDETGSSVYLGVSSSQRGKINNIFQGIVQSSDSGGNFTYKALNQTHELTVRLLGGVAGDVKDHGVGDSSFGPTVGLSDAVRMRIVKDGGTTEGTRIVKSSSSFRGPLLNNVDILFEGITLRNTAITQPGLEGNGLFRTAGINKFELKDVICQQSDTQGDGVLFTCTNGSYNFVSYREGTMNAMPKGMFDVITGSEAVVDGIITSGVTDGKSSNNPAGLTDRIVS